MKEKYKINYIFCFNPTDDWLQNKLEKRCQKLNIQVTFVESPNFIYSEKEIQDYFSKNKFFMNSFYIYSRKKLNILIENNQPIGGKWSYDTENRKKIPKNIKIIEDYKLGEYYNWKYTRKDAEEVLENFLKFKLKYFGDYEDAILDDKSFLFHSTLSPYLNVGLLDPLNAIKKAIYFYELKKGDISIASIEGFIRQIIGWREYMRAVYILKGREIRRKNFFGFTKKLPYSFWEGKTGNKVVDQIICRTIFTAYNHHIERLMILGNYMLLNEYDPDEVYKWFMEMYIDAYDWVMVPNVYSMSQYADGGLITTKPYICSSNYIKKMSNFADKDKVKLYGDNWSKEFDMLYWEFILKHKDRFKDNPRMQFILKLAEKRNK